MIDAQGGKEMNKQRAEEFAQPDLQQTCNNLATDCISRQVAIEHIHSLYPSEPIMRRNRERWEKKYKPYIEAEKALEMLPSAQPTLYGYNIEHLELIARVLQKENLPPERIVEALTDIGRIVAIVKDEYEEALRKAVEQCMI